MEMRELARALLIFGGIAVVTGAFLFFSGRLPLRLGRLPGDIIHRGEHSTFYFPIATSTKETYHIFADDKTRLKPDAFEWFYGW